MTALNHVFIPFEGNVNPGDTMGIKLYLQETKEIDKETDKLDISVSNNKDIIDHFLGIYNKYGWVSLAFIVGTTTGENNIFIIEEYIQLADMQKQTHGNFGLIGIGNVSIAPLQDNWQYHVLPTYLVAV